MTNNKFDLDLKFGQKFEQEFANIFGDTQKVEVKAERGMWVKTGNIAFERNYRGKPSGLDVTKSKWWVQVLVVDNNIVGMLVFHVPTLKKKLNLLNKTGKVRIVNGGDGNQSELWLVALKDVQELFRVVEKSS